MQMKAQLCKTLDWEVAGFSASFLLYIKLASKQSSSHIRKKKKQQ